MLYFEILYALWLEELSQASIWLHALKTLLLHVLHCHVVLDLGAVGYIHIISRFIALEPCTMFLG